MKTNSAREAEHEVVWPLGKGRTQRIDPVPRLDTLESKTICELWNWNFRGDVVFSKLEELLSKRYPSVKFVSYKEFGNTHGGHEEATMASLPDTLSLKGCDAVISAVGA